MPNKLVITVTVPLPDDIFEATTIQANTLELAKAFKEALTDEGDVIHDFSAAILPASEPFPVSAFSSAPTPESKPTRKRRTKEEIAAAGSAAAALAQTEPEPKHFPHSHSEEDRAALPETVVGGETAPPWATA